MGIKVTCRTNGPYLIEGQIDLYDAGGKPFNLNGRTKIALCRCGASRAKPFCDGAHNRIHFESAEADHSHSTKERNS